MICYKQNHLIKEYHNLSKEDKINFKKQLKKIKYIKMYKLYKHSYKNMKINIKEIKPLNVIKKSNKYKNIGIDLIKKGEYGVVIMAGGNGTRLGFNGPKGCLELNIDNKFISLFELYIIQLKRIIDKYNIVIPIYIMTNTENNNEIINYFEKKNYFNYPKNKIKFFKQSNLPILDVNGKIILKDEKNILFGPNGNGDIFKALKKSKLIKDMMHNNLKYLLFVNVDNILNNLVDFDFIGTVISQKYKLASKTIKINGAKEWIFCKYKNRPFMLPTEYLNNKLFDFKQNNEYIYRYKNISYYLISISLIKKFTRVKIPYHRAYKKSKYLNSPNKPNSFKFEKFIFDAFYYSKDMLLYETDQAEFYPIKRISDIKGAIEMYKKNNQL